MSSTIIVNGRRYTSGAGAPLSNEILQAPIGVLGLPDPNFVDGPWDLRYRLVDSAQEELRWMTMPDVKRLIRKPESWIIEQVRKGRIDCGMVRGSTVPLFRFLDRVGIIRDTLVETPPVQRERTTK